jgi:starvation-inducible DNA-binding protein
MVSVRYRGAIDTFVQWHGRTSSVDIDSRRATAAVTRRSNDMSNSIRGGMPERGEVVQAFGTLESSRIGLGEPVRAKSVAALNRLLAHTMALRDLYKKAHWQTSGASFYELHLLFDKHHDEQVEIMDALAERVQTLGGVALALAHDVVEETRIARAPRGRERVVDQLRRLVDAHEIVLEEARPLAREAAERGDDGSNDLIVSQVVRTNELQSWFVYEHLHAHDAPR